MAFNIVEFASGGENDAFDQPCRFGHRVDGRAVYCHNDAWHELVQIRSISFGRGGGFAAFLLERSAKGEAVMEANWRAAKAAAQGDQDISQTVKGEDNG